MGIPAHLTVLAMIAEVAGSVGLLFGLLSRVAALGVLADLYPRFFMNWAGNQPSEGYGYHLLAIALIVAILVRGGGALSIDRAIAARVSHPQ